MLAQFFTLSSHSKVTVLPPPEAGRLSSLSSVRICNKQWRKGYSKAISICCVSSCNSVYQKAYLKPLNKQANGEFKGRFSKLQYQECLQQHSLWRLDNLKIDWRVGSAFRSSEKDLTDSWEAVNNDMVVKVYSPVHLRIQTKAQTVWRTLCHFGRLHTYD